MKTRRTEILSEMTRIERSLDRAIQDLQVISNRLKVEILINEFDPSRRNMHIMDGSTVRILLQNHINKMEQELKDLYKELGGFIQ